MAIWLGKQYLVICRIGSLEKKDNEMMQLANVICRIGSLEIHCPACDTCLFVICRIGSLEI